MMEIRDRIIELWDQGLNGREIAPQVGVGESTVYRVLARAGVPVEERARRKSRGIPDECLPELRARYEAGESAQELAKAYRATGTTVRNALLRAGASVRPKNSDRRRVWAASDMQALADAYREGFTQEELAAKFRTSQAQVGRLLRQAGAIRDDRRIRRGEGRTFHRDGYVFVRVYDDDPDAAVLSPMRNRSGYVLEHRAVMARSLGRPLTPTETVHHVNGDRTDNRVGNLQLRQGRHGKGARFVCVDCGSHNVDPVPFTDQGA